jgi:dihydrofolate reductase
MPLTQFYTAASLDGFLADEDGSLQWLFDAAGGEDPGEGPEDSGWAGFFGAVGAMAMGATTYEWVHGHEELDRHPERWTRVYAGVPCWVFTHRDLPVVTGADVRFVSGPVAPVHAEMAAAAADRNVWLVGGGDLVGQFHDDGLLDQLVVTLAPVTLGAGAPLLPRRVEGMTLRDVRTTGALVSLTYDVPGGSGSRHGGEPLA